MKIRRQIREMKSCGIGGFFIHSRDGLETEYLSDKWFECVSAAVDEAKEWYVFDGFMMKTDGRQNLRRKYNCN